MTTVAKKLAQIKPGTLLAGLDLGLDSLTCVVLDASGQRMDRFKAPQSRGGMSTCIGAGCAWSSNRAPVGSWLAWNRPTITGSKWAAT